MTSTEYITRSDGKRVAITTPSGGNFMRQNKVHFLLDPDEAPLHATPRDTRPPDSVQIPISDDDDEALSAKLCARCSAIDLTDPDSLCSEQDWHVNIQAARQTAVDEHRSRGRTQIEGHVCVLGQYLDDFRTSICPLCRTLASIRTRLTPSPLNIAPWPYELHVVSAAYAHFAERQGGAVNIDQILKARQIEDTVIFAVDPKPPHIFFYGRVGFWLTEHSGTSGHLYPVVLDGAKMERRFSGRQLKTDRIDYTVLKSWLASCNTYHSESCGYRASDRGEIPAFRLIDCYTRRIILANKDVPYVALSYTWGFSDLPSPGPLSQLPVESNVLVVEDTIIVTKALGLRFLWVDQYCIIQDDLDVKTEQIRNMDAVYEGAEVTIIAAAGDDASFGLPGVSSRSRVPQPCVKIKDRTFVSSGPQLEDLLTLSKWQSRGWTYQEGLLSRRRLIFTEYQVYFECGLSQCCEAITAPADVLFQEIQIPPDTLYQALGMGDFYSMASQELRTFPLRKPIAKAHQVLKRIEEYASKNMTYTSDALNGILGIFTLAGKQTPSTAHLWGIPILTHTETTPPRFIAADSPRSRPEQIQRSTDQALLHGLRWTIAPQHRNLEFPSWSWAGWKGPLQLHFPPADVEYALPDVPPRTTFWVERDDGQREDWTSFHTTADAVGRLPSVTRFLHVEGPAVKLRFQYGRIFGKSEAFPHEQDVYGPHVLLAINDLQIAICPLHITKLEDDMEAFLLRLLRGTWYGLILSHRGAPLPPETDVLGKEVELTYEMLARDALEEWELLILEDVGNFFARIGTVRLAFPTQLQMPSPGGLKLERKRFRIG